MGEGEVGDEPTDEASVRVSREPWEEARERPEMLWSESSAEEWVEDEAARIAATFMLAISGAS